MPINYKDFRKKNNLPENPYGGMGAGKAIQNIRDRGDTSFGQETDLPGPQDVGMGNKNAIDRGMATFGTDRGMGTQRGGDGLPPVGGDFSDFAGRSMKGFQTGFRQGVELEPEFGPHIQEADLPGKNIYPGSFDFTRDAMQQLGNRHDPSGFGERLPPERIGEIGSDVFASNVDKMVEEKLPDVGGGEIDSTLIEEPAAELPIETLDTPESQITTTMLPDVGGDQDLDAGADATYGDDALDQYSEYAMGDEDPMVTAERSRLERNNLLRSEQAKRQAHERAVNSNYQPGTPQYEQIMRNAITDSSNQNIQAEKNFNDFARARRSDRQRELMNIHEAGVDAKEAAWDRFEDVVKFLPSLKSKEALLRAQLGGVDLSTTIQGMYGTDGIIKDEYKDLTQAQLVYEGIVQSVDQMKFSPDGDAWEDGEKEKYADTFYQENFENILYGSQEQGEARDVSEEQKGRIKTFVETGDASKMIKEDWGNLDATQRATLQDKSKPWDKQGTELWQPNDVINKDNDLYVVKSNEEIWSYGDKTFYQITVINTVSGEQEKVFFTLKK